MAGIDREESDTADHEESLANEVTMSSILDAGVSSDCSVDSFLLNGELTDSSGTVLLAQENLLTDNFSSLFETDSIFQGMCGSARGVHAAIRLVKLESHLVLERTHDAPPTVIAGFPTASALISSLAGSRGDVPAEGEIKQLASKLRSVVDLLSDDQAQYLQVRLCLGMSAGCIPNTHSTTGTGSAHRSELRHEGIGAARHRRGLSSALRAEACRSGGACVAPGRAK